MKVLSFAFALVLSCVTADPKELVQLAIRQRDEGLLHPSMPNYQNELRKAWGGPPPRWHATAMSEFAVTYAAQRGRTALITGGTGGIGFYVAELLAAVGLTIILPARPGLLHEATSARDAILASVPGATVVVPEPSLDLASFASVRTFATHLTGEKGDVRVIDVLVLNAGIG